MLKDNIVLSNLNIKYIQKQKLSIFRALLNKHFWRHGLVQQLIKRNYNNVASVINCQIKWKVYSFASKLFGQGMAVLCTYLQVLWLNFLPCRRHDCELSLHWHVQVSGLRGWFRGHCAAHTHPHSSASHRCPAGHNLPSPWPSHWHSPN